MLAFRKCVEQAWDQTPGKSKRLSFKFPPWAFASLVTLNPDHSNFTLVFLLPLRLRPSLDGPLLSCPRLSPCSYVTRARGSTGRGHEWQTE